MAHTSFAALQQSCGVRLLLTLDTGFVFVPHGLCPTLITVKAITSEVLTDKKFYYK